MSSLLFNSHMRPCEYAIRYAVNMHDQYTVNTQLCRSYVTKAYGTDDTGLAADEHLEEK